MSSNYEMTVDQALDGAQMAKSRYLDTSAYTAHIILADEVKRLRECEDRFKEIDAACANMHDTFKKLGYVGSFPYRDLGTVSLPDLVCWAETEITNLRNKLKFSEKHDAIIEKSMKKAFAKFLSPKGGDTMAKPKKGKPIKMPMKGGKKGSC